MNHRQQQILERLYKGRAEISALAVEFGVCEMTIRRDLRELESRRLALVVKNGAVVHPACYEPMQADANLTPLKFALAEALYQEVMPCQRMFIGTGFTALAFARVVARLNQRYMKVVTHSLSAAASLFRSSAKVILPGGELRSSSLDLVGDIAEREVMAFHVNWLVSGCDAADARAGFYTSDRKLSRLEQKTISLAERVAIVTESHKFRLPALTRFATPRQVQLLVTDDGLPDESREFLEKEGVKVVLVARNGSGYPLNSE